MSSEPASPIHLHIVDVHKSYGDHHVLKGVTFDVYRGQTNIIMGRSGSGKTVLLRQLLRLEKPDRGRIELDGVDIASLDEVELAPLRPKMAVVFQDGALFDSLSVFDNVAFALREHEHPSHHELEHRVEQQLRALGVLDARDKLPAELSGGMRKRVAVARAMITNPALLIYDEPTRGLDPLLARSVDKLIDETRERFGMTTLLISHDMNTALTIGHYINLLDDGRIAYGGTPAELLRTRHPLATAFLKQSGIKPPKRDALEPV